jgi:hypothetical protein
MQTRTRVKPHYAFNPDRAPAKNAVLLRNDTTLGDNTVCENNTVFKNRWKPVALLNSPKSN